MSGGSPPAGEEDLLRAVAERAAARAVLGSALAGFLAGLLALAFLWLSGSRVDATTVPVVVLLAIGQLAGVVAAGSAALRLRELRSGMPVRETAERAQRGLRTLARVTGVVGALTAVAMPVLLEPRATASFTAIAGLGVLAQVVVVLTVVRRPLSRVARAAHR
ncbi:hypothetical protein ACFP6A_01560 [Quadrisphaera sp. GCM10027208]|uniref:hypothetical protein n=1 Tax=Quadrisphaera sp. GCM10027208 TaxID=3273423 RepID=UPI00360C1B34